MQLLLLLLFLSGLGDRSRRGVANCDPLGIFCDFEKPCAWRWIGLIELSGDRINKTIFEDPETQISGPVADADDNPNGHFLYVAGGVGAGKAVELTSPWYRESGSNCRISVALHMHNMEDGNLKLMVETRNHTWLIMETLGDSLRKWRVLTQNVGRIRQPFRFKWELLEGLKTPAHAAIDNLKLDRCLLETPTERECFQMKRAFYCDDGRCLAADQVCDIRSDCLGGEDEDQDCDELPFGARCTFESGWCGWSNTHKDDTDWIRHNGTTPTLQTGPSLDNTYKNSTGMYAYVDMSSINEIGDSAVLQSPKFPPPPGYHSNPSSPYYDSCQIRFFYHLFGPHIGDLVVRVVEDDNKHGKIMSIWREHRSLGDLWQRAAVSLPRNMKHWYSIQFVGKRGIRFRGDVAIDDVSLSPECFGIGVPDNETLDWTPDNTSTSEDSDFTRVTLTTCDAKGRVGPLPSMCERAYRGSSTQVQVISQGRFSGVQVWTVPRTTLYTIVARGASGGTGSSSFTTGSGSHGALVRAVFSLKEGTQVYFLVGQEGSSAGRKLKSRPSPNDTSSGSVNSTEVKWGLERVRKMKNSSLGEISDDGAEGTGGGGGGATFVFLLDPQGLPIPLLVAAGGGGMGSGQDTPNTTSANGRGLNSSSPPTSGRSPPEGAGGGGGYNDSVESSSAGMPLVDGSLGGYPCEDVADWLTSGGFGGGGGACLAGGGGGGYGGGSAYNQSSDGGEGGYSYVGADALDWSVSVELGRHLGAGVVDIIPAEEEACECSFLCAALDVGASERVCVCPEDWQLEENGTTCAGTAWLSTWYLIVLIVAIVILLAVFGVVCAFLYNRYQRQKLATLRRKAMAATELQLSRLRGTSSGMVTEYNPNYEFGTGCPGSIQDLKEIPRENLRLIKALGQGAFGEVYQGYLRHVVGDSVEMPVAVKTLPELSSNQAEMDFLMEALIMSKFHHPNIVHFIGVCFEKHPRFILLELLSGGDLKTFLRDSRPKPERPSLINMRDLLKCALDVAKGCRYLEENHFIHRDIAARNCLLTTKGPGRVVKIADFGMARDIYRADYYRKGGKAMLPVKWMPPEAFLDGIFTSKTDVWSFGVLLWEVMSLGYMPYPGRGNQEVMQLVTNGGRLEAPPGCPAPVYRVMTQCWCSNPDDRPSFATVLERIGYCMQDPNVLATPLPIFHRPPSAERDTTVVRPAGGSDPGDCLQVLRPFSAAATLSATTASSNDYLIPLDTEGSMENETAATTSRDREGIWETSFNQEGIAGVERMEESSLQDTPGPSRRRSKGYSQIPAYEESPTSAKLSQSQSTQPLLDSKSAPESPVTETSSAYGVNEIQDAADNRVDSPLLSEKSYANIQVTADTQQLLQKGEVQC